jgi:hypothetical protein
LIAPGPSCLITLANGLALGVFWGWMLSLFLKLDLQQVALTLLRLVPLVLDVTLDAACALFFLNGLFRSILAGPAPLRGLVKLVAYVVLRPA